MSSLHLHGLAVKTLSNDFEAAIIVMLNKKNCLEISKEVASLSENRNYFKISKNKSSISCGYGKRRKELTPCHGILDRQDRAGIQKIFVE